MVLKAGRAIVRCGNPSRKQPYFWTLEGACGPAAGRLRWQTWQTWFESSKGYQARQMQAHDRAKHCMELRSGPTCSTACDMGCGQCEVCCTIRMGGSSSASQGPALAQQGSPTATASKGTIQGSRADTSALNGTVKSQQRLSLQLTCSLNASSSLALRMRVRRAESLFDRRLQGDTGLQLRLCWCQPLRTCREWR